MGEKIGVHSTELKNPGFNESLRYIRNRVKLGCIITVYVCAKRPIDLYNPELYFLYKRSLIKGFGKGVIYWDSTQSHYPNRECQSSWSYPSKAERHLR